ncbi:MAG: type IV pilus assembly protein PilF [Gammaproteobacteria bacterium]|nr:MAG: type IV pilus assembly protein PilF [Gammaproteobacteria bacterium]TND00889.1 MAG: type IV pilus assembly protein PilF [Gammaproteobacteria bacterium]
MNPLVKGAVMLLIVFAVAGCAGTSKRDGHESAAEINAKLGLAYLQQGNAELAIEKLKKALEQDSKLASAHHYIAEAYRQSGEYDNAREHFKRALSLSSHDGAMYNNYGVFLCDAGDFKEADRAFLQAVKVHAYKEQADAYENAGLCALREPDLKRAEQRFRAALKLRPQQARSLLQMTEISLTDKSYLEARAFLQRYEAAAPHTARSLWLGVQIERELGNRDDATKYGNLLGEQYPDAEETRLYRKLAESQ